MVDAIRSFVEVHPILCVIVALVLWSIRPGVVERAIRAEEKRIDPEGQWIRRGDGLPKNWPYRRGKTVSVDGKYELTERDRQWLKEFNSRHQ